MPWDVYFTAEAPLKSLNEIKQRRPPDPERMAAIKRAMQLDTALHQLRERVGVSQAVIAERLNSTRANVSRIERESDIRLSTLERYVEALGGRVVIDVLIDDERIPLVGA